MLERAQNRIGFPPQVKESWLYSLQGVVLAVLVYSALHIGARLMASGNLGEDDPLDAILSQSFALGYLPSQPPLYDWALWLLGTIMGPGALRFQLLKYGLLTASCAFIFLAARRVMKGDAFWAFLSVEALALIYQISWRFHEGFTHAVGAMCAVAALFWALLRLSENRRLLDYAIFGLCAGLGLLTVTSFGVYLAGLVIAGSFQPAIRRALADRRMALALLIAGVIIAPHLSWLIAQPGGLAAAFPALTSDLRGDDWTLALEGLRRAFTEPLMYLAPLIFLYPIFFPAWLPIVWRTTRLWADRDGPADYEQLILHVTLLNLLALIAGALLFGINRYPVHALMPLFLITSIWLTAKARMAARNAGEIRRFVMLALGIAIFAFWARAANMYVLEPVCNICRWGIPYAELADEMKAAGFQNGRIIVAEAELGGNLLRFLPQAQIALLGKRSYMPPSSEGDARLAKAFVWKANADTDRMVGIFRQALPALTASDLSRARKITLQWQDHLWKPDGYRSSQWRLLIMK